LNRTQAPADGLRNDCGLDALDDGSFGTDIIAGVSAF